MMGAPPYRTAARAEPERSFPPPSRLGAFVAGGVAALAGLLALALLVRLVTVGISFAGFLMLLTALALLAAGGMAGYWAWACYTLRYELGRGVLTIRWGLVRHEIPVPLLQRALRGSRLATPAVTGLNWPGCHIGYAVQPRLGRIRFFSLHRSPAEVLYLAGDAGAYAVSVAERASFVRALQEQAELSTALTEPRVVAHPLLQPERWLDRAALPALALTAALALLTTAIMFSRYAGFPDQIVVDFPAGPRITGRGVLLTIPLLAWLVLAGNGAAGVALLRRQRTPALTLLYGASFVTGLLALAAITVA
jgi:hypothetical protein